MVRGGEISPHVYTFYHSYDYSSWEILLVPMICIRKICQSMQGIIIAPLCNYIT